VSIHKRNGKIIARSDLEKGIRDDLEDRGVVFDYEKLDLAVFLPVKKGICPACGARAVQAATYKPDYKIFKEYGPALIVEAKGRFTSKNRSKMAEVKKQYPSLDIRMVFQRNNKLPNKTAPTYLDWAKLHGIPAVVGKTIPEEWLKGARHETR